MLASRPGGAAIYYESLHDTELDLILIHSLLVLGLPALVVAVSLAATQGRGYADLQSCWLSTSNHVIWAFVAPALLIVSVSFVYCLMHSRVECEGRRGALMVSALDSGSSELGSSAGRDHCVVLLGKIL